MSDARKQFDSSPASTSRAPLILALWTILGVAGCTERGAHPAASPPIARLKLYHYAPFLSHGNWGLMQPEERLRLELQAFFSDIAGDRPIGVEVRNNYDYEEVTTVRSDPLRPGETCSLPARCHSYTLTLSGDLELLESSLKEFIDAAEQWRPKITDIELD